jgi:hypothetical protein
MEFSNRQSNKGNSNNINPRFSNLKVNNRKNSSKDNPRFSNHRRSSNHNNGILHGIPVPANALVHRSPITGAARGLNGLPAFGRMTVAG